MVDNKIFWKTVKPHLSNKLVKSDKIHLNENGELLKRETETLLNNSFSNIAKNLTIHEYENLNSNIAKVEDAVLRATSECKNSASIIVIKEKLKNTKFSFRKQTIRKLRKKLGG